MFEKIFTSNIHSCIIKETMEVKEMELRHGLSIQEKLRILADAAKYDVACTSSGVDRKGKKGSLGNSKACGICHSFSADGRCISLLKVLMTNHCVYDCKYCANRVSNDTERTAFTPRELCELTVEFYKRNYIEGLFLSSGVQKNPAYTMEKMCEALELLRTEYHFNGYIHVKAVPGAPDDLIMRAGYLADRMSINLELPTAEGMKKLAPNKSHQTILRPMAKVTDTIAANRLAHGKSAYLERSTSNRYLTGSIFSEEQRKLTGNQADRIGESSVYHITTKEHEKLKNRPFASAGQSTQMIIGATPETDYHLLRTTQSLYQKYDLKRVFFSAYVPVNEDRDLPALDAKPPLLREHRLYQADWLLRFYGFHAEERCRNRDRILTSRSIPSVSGHSGIWNFFRWRSIRHLMNRSCGSPVWVQSRRAGSCAQEDTEVWTLII